MAKVKVNIRRWGLRFKKVKSCRVLQKMHPASSKKWNTPQALKGFFCCFVTQIFQNYLEWRCLINSWHRFKLGVKNCKAGTQKEQFIKLLWFVSKWLMKIVKKKTFELTVIYLKLFCDFFSLHGVFRDKNVTRVQLGIIFRKQFAQTLMFSEQNV